MPTRQQQQKKEAAAAMLLVNTLSAGQVGQVFSLLANGADPNIATEGGVYPLNHATLLGRLDLVQLVLGHGAKVDSRTGMGNTPLHTACVEGFSAIVQELLSAGANPNKMDRDGCHPLHWVARKGKTEVLRKLIGMGAQVNAKDADGFAPIHHAADTGNLPAMRELVRVGSSHSWRTHAGQTPLIISSFNGHAAIVKYLVDECKADPGVADGQGFTSVAVAAQQGHLAVVKVLLSCGVSRLGTIGYPDALNGVAMSGNLKMIRELINAEGGVHVKGVKTSAKMTPLHFAAGYCHPLATSMLLAAGVDENATDSKGETPVDIVDTLRHEHLQHGVGRRQVKRMLAQAPAYRARSWRWPNASVADLRSPGVPTKSAEGLSERGAGSAKGGIEPAEMTSDDLECVSNSTMVIAPASAGEGTAGVMVFRRPVIGPSWSAAGGNSGLVASLIRYSQKK